MNVTHSIEETNRTRLGLINLATRPLFESNQSKSTKERDSGTSAKNEKWDNRSINDAKTIPYSLMDKPCLGTDQA
jgi:hypothetical protein